MRPAVFIGYDWGKTCNTYAFMVASALLGASVVAAGPLPEPVKMPQHVVAEGARKPRKMSRRDSLWKMRLKYLRMDF